MASKNEASRALALATMREARCMRCGQDMDKLFNIPPKPDPWWQPPQLRQTQTEEEHHGIEWLCETCKYAESMQDSGRWQKYVRMSNPLHAACAAGDLLAFRELWSGPGARYLPPGRGGPGPGRTVDVRAECGGMSGLTADRFGGFTPLMFACMRPTAAWPPPPPPVGEEEPSEADEAESTGSLGGKSSRPNRELVRQLLNLGASTLLTDYVREWRPDRYAQHPLIEALLLLARRGEEREVEAIELVESEQWVLARDKMNASRDAYRQADLASRIQLQASIEAKIDRAFCAMAREQVAQAVCSMDDLTRLWWRPDDSEMAPLKSEASRKLLEGSGLLLRDSREGWNPSVDASLNRPGALYLVMNLREPSDEANAIRLESFAAQRRMGHLTSLCGARQLAEELWRRALGGWEVVLEMSKGRTRDSLQPISYVPFRFLSGVEGTRTEEAVFIYRASVARQLGEQSAQSFREAKSLLALDGVFRVIIDTLHTEQMFFRRMGLSRALEGWRDTLFTELAQSIDAAEEDIGPEILSEKISPTNLALTPAQEQEVQFWWKTRMQRLRKSLQKVAEMEWSRRASQALQSARVLFAMAAPPKPPPFQKIRFAACRSEAQFALGLFVKVEDVVQVKACREFLVEIDRAEEAHIRYLAEIAYVPKFKEADRLLAVAARTRQIWAAEEAVELYEESIRIMLFQRRRFPSFVIRLPVAEARARICIGRCLLYQREAAVLCGDECTLLASSASGPMQRRQWPRAHAVQGLALLLSGRRDEAVASWTTGLTPKQDPAVSRAVHIESTAPSADAERINEAVEGDEAVRTSEDVRGCGRLGLQMRCLIVLALAEKDAPVSLP